MRSPLATIPVVPTAVQLIIRTPDAVDGVSANWIGTEIFNTPAVYILVEYRVSNSADPVDVKYTDSGWLSRIANTSAIYLLASYCDGIDVSVPPVSYLFGIVCL